MNLIDVLTKRLKEPLPGINSQSKMFPGKSRILPDVQTLEAARKAAVCILLFEKDDEWMTTLIKRVEYKGVHSGQMAFPGGKKEKNENYIQTALRETQEEIGIVVEGDKVIGKLSPVYIPPSNMYVEPIIAFYPQIPVYQKQETEVDSVVEVSLNLLLDDGIRKVKPVKQNNGLNIKVPYFDIYNYTVWGATAVMLSEFIDVLKSTKNQ